MEGIKQQTKKETVPHSGSFMHLGKVIACLINSQTILAIFLQINYIGVQ